MSRIIAPQWVNRRRRGEGLPRLQANRLRRRNYNDLTSIDGLEALYDARRLEVGADSPVETWPDLSGFNRDVSQATSAARPLFRQSALNGVACVEFDGDDDLLATTQLGNQWSGDPAAPLTVLAVVEFVSGSGTVVGAIHSTNNDRLRLRVDGTPDWVIEHHDGSFATTSSTSADTSPHVIVAQIEENTGRRIRIDGTTQVSDGGYSRGDTTMDQFGIGAAHFETPSEFVAVKVGILSVYTTWVEGPELFDAETFLGDAYGITIS